MSFNAATRTFSGTPSVAGSWNVMVTAQDSFGAVVSTTLQVTTPNEAPVITTSIPDFNLVYAKVYADNPFAQRHWQTLNVSAESAGTVTIRPTFNGVAGSDRTLDADGRCAFEVPRNAPAIGNTMQVGLTVFGGGERVRLHGFSLDYRDHTERRRNR